jgi:hypothetical protein
MMEQRKESGSWLYDAAIVNNAAQQDAKLSSNA